MIVHSLNYRSQTVTGLAYFLAFVTLAISQVTTFGVLMLIPLAASLLYIAHRNAWNRFALFGLVATYLTCGLHRDTGSPLWQTQGLFLLYWLLFEAFDLLRADPWLLPLNGLGFLALSAGKWTHAAPDQIWQLAAGAAALYLAGAIARARTGRWKPAVLFNAALAATAIVLKLHDQWLALALLIEAELYYLAGVRFRSTFLRNLAGALFGLQLGDLLAEVIVGLSPHAWEPVAALNVAAFYLNRALQVSEVWYGYAAAAMAALISGVEASDPWRGPVWSLMALGPFALGWWRRLLDFRLQGYASRHSRRRGHNHLSALPGALSRNRRRRGLRFRARRALERRRRVCGANERDALRLAASCLTTMGLCTLVWRLVPGEYLGIAWLALALLMLEAGLRGLPDEFRAMSCIVGVIAVARVAGFDLSSRLALISSALAYAFAWRARKEAGGRVLDVATWPATLFLLAGLHALLPAWAVSPSWALAALALAEFDRRSLHAQAFLVSAVVATRCLVIDLQRAATRPRHRTHHRLLLGRHATPQTRQPAPVVQFSARHHAARRSHLSRSHRQPAHRRLGCRSRRSAGRGLRLARSRAPPLRPRAVPDLHGEALLLGPPQSGNAAAHHQLYRAGPAPGNRQLGLYPFPRSGPALSVTSSIPDSEKRAVMDSTTGGSSTPGYYTLDGSHHA